MSRFISKKLKITLECSCGNKEEIEVNKLIEEQPTAETFDIISHPDDYTSLECRMCGEVYSIENY